MRCSPLFAAILLVAALGTSAMADIVPFNATPLTDDNSQSGGGYNGRTDAPTRGVVAGDSASMSLVMMDSALHSISVNTPGEVSVTRGNTFADLGANRNGGGHILGVWDEIVQGNSVYVDAIFKTADGSQFVPFNASVNGQPVFFWAWHFGTTNPVNFQSWVTNVTLTSAHVYFSSNGGQSFTTSSDLYNNMSHNWNPGMDVGLMQNSIGDGTNFMLLQYQITIVPAPAGLAVLAGASLLGFRRRR
jgi:hypothetical protein